MENRKKLYISIIIILILQISLFHIVFLLRQGYHSDEVWNYGFANSYYIKDLTSTNDGVSLLDSWHDSSLLKDYITVDSNHRFSYDAIIQNCNMDYNPPFQFMVLHTICSLFPGVFSWYFCFIINIFSFIVSQIFIYKLSKSISKSELIGVISIIFYGFCVGCLDIVIFMRMYSLGTMIGVVFMYYSHKIYSNRKIYNKQSVIDYIICFVSLFLGAYTMHVFLIPAFAISACYSLYYIFSKRFKLLFAYGFICLGAVFFSFAAYPKTFSNLGINLFNISNNVTSTVSYAVTKYPLNMQLRLYAFQFTRDLLGIHISPLPNPYLEWFLIGLSCVIVLITPFAFVFRKDEWFKKFIKKILTRLKDIFKKAYFFNFSIFVLLVASLLVWFVASWKTSWYYMNTYANRYLFVAYPLASTLIVVTIYYIIKLLLDNKKIAIIITLIFSLVLPISSHFMSQSHALLFYHESEGVTLDDIEDNSNCVVLLDLGWVIVLFAPKLYKTNSYFATTIYTYNLQKYFDDPDYSKDYYVILDQQFMLSRELDESNESDHNLLMLAGSRASFYTLEKDVINYFEAEDNVDYLEYVGTDYLMKRKYKIYKVHFMH